MVAISARSIAGRRKRIGAMAQEDAVIHLDRRQMLRAAAAAALGGFGAQQVHAQAPYPKRPVRVIVPFAAGGVGEAAIRALAPRIERRLGQKLVIEAKPGAAGNIGTLEVARADADGYPLLVGARATSSSISSS